MTGSTAAVAVAAAGVCGCGWLRFLAVLRDLYDWWMRQKKMMFGGKEEPCGGARIHFYLSRSRDSSQLQAIWLCAFPSLHSGVSSLFGSMLSEGVTLLKLLPSSQVDSAEQRFVLGERTLSGNLVAPPPRSPEPPDPPVPPDLTIG
uniref:Uncharacterized protein n=1 Tax=Brassica oleracea var. oleracea TaxID=109376 RepID=A0A0D3EET5_BRAOL